MFRSVRGRSGKHTNHISTLGDEVHVKGKSEDGLAVALSSLKTPAVEEVACFIMIIFIVQKSVWARIIIECYRKV